MTPLLVTVLGKNHQLSQAKFGVFGEGKSRLFGEIETTGTADYD